MDRARQRTAVRELSLFTGAGGGLLASKMLGWTTIGYVEIDEYCQKIIAQRIRDGWLDEAPIFGDVRAFISEGYADAYQGMVDVLTAGFPCQAFSVAGKKRAGDDERNMWPATIECIRRIRPREVFLENAPGLLAGSHGYFGRILGDLAESGYIARWRCLSAAEVGAPHKRDRLWILAFPERPRLEGHPGDGDGRHESRRVKEAPDRSVGASDLCDTTKQGLSLPDRTEEAMEKPAQVAELERSDWWASEPDVGRVAHGVASRVDRLKAIGNGQVPACAAMAYMLLRQTGVGESE